jgi:hypothetical protein
LKMGSSYITLDDPRVALHCSRPGRVFSLDGLESSQSYPFPHSIHSNGFHLEPRMTSVYALPKSFNLNPGDSASFSVQGTPLLGIVLELADHHFDLELLIDGIDPYQAFSRISSYLPSSDGFGYVHWLLLDREKHEITLRVSDQYNRMLDASGIQPSHACLSGFIAMDEMLFPPPVYHHWMYTQDPLPPDTRGRVSSFGQAAIPAGEKRYLMDLYGQGSLESLAFQVDRPVILEIMDGGAAQPEYPHDFPSWIRRADLNLPTSGALAAVLEVTERGDHPGLNVLMKQPIRYASRLIIRLSNPSPSEATISQLYLDGTQRCI